MLPLQNFDETHFFLTDLFFLIPESNEFQGL